MAQTAFARAYASWPRVSRAGNPEAYVRRIVVNENLKRFRKHRVAERLTGTLPESGTPDATRESDERSALIAALQQLGPRQRAVVVLRYWLDLSETEVATVLGCSVGTVKSQASRALASLRPAAAQATSPASGRYTATVHMPGPDAPAGAIAYGTVNGQWWELVASEPGTEGAGHGQQLVTAS